MPDLLTHFLVAYLLVQIIGIRRYASIIYVGAILPDILSRSFMLADICSYWFFEPLHTPLVLILSCSLVSYFFEEEIRGEVFAYLLAGVSLHLFMDVFQKHMALGYPWLFPFSWTDCEIGLLWPELSIYFIPVLLSVIVSYWWYRRIRS